MNFLRKHWFDLGGVLSIAFIGYVQANRNVLTGYQTLMWLHLISLFLHQLEEYRFPGTFPGMVNAAVYRSGLPDRYPLNTNTAFLVNVVVGWTAYFSAAFFAEKAIWLGLATIVISLGNVAAHTFFFNARAKTVYNAGLATCWLLFTPCAGLFFWTVNKEQLAGNADVFAGVALGVVLNVVGIRKLIDWLADKNTPYVFETRHLLPNERQKLQP